MTQRVFGMTRKVSMTKIMTQRVFGMTNLGCRLNFLKQKKNLKNLKNLQFF